MEQQRLPISRIRLPLSGGPRDFTVGMHRDSHLIAYSDPIYPPEAQAKGIEGKVILNAVIGKDGAVQELSVSEGDPLLAASALETVRHWTYRPTTVNGVPVEVVTRIEVNFRS
jgi:TonB family protein